MVVVKAKGVDIKMDKEIVEFKNELYLVSYKKDGKILLTPVENLGELKIKKSLSEYSYDELWEEIFSRPATKDYHNVIMGNEEGEPFFINERG